MIRAARLLCLTLVLAAVPASPAAAIPLFGVNGTSLYRLDSNGSAAPIQMPITGLVGGDTVVGIDSRPADGRIYLLGSGSRLYTLNPLTGAATQVGSDGQFALSGTYFGFDFNPTVDRIRVVSDTEQNLRLNPDTGGLSSTDTNLNPPGDVIAAAYTNNVPGATTTTLYDIDRGSSSLLIQNPPNTGMLTTVGPLGIPLSPGNHGFDIAPDGTALASLTQPPNMSGLYRINLATGAATLVRGLGIISYTGLTAAASSVRLDVADLSVAEGGRATLTATRMGSTLGAVSVDYLTQAGSAEADVDFTSQSGMLSWADGEAGSRTISLAVTADGSFEPDESFTVALSNPVNGVGLAPPSAANVTIPAQAAPAPPPAPPAAPDTSAPALRLLGPRSQKLGAAIRRGVLVRLSTNEACRLTADLLLSARTAKGLRLARRVGRRTASITPATRSLRVKLTTKAKRRLRRVRAVTLTAQASCSDAAGNRARARRTLKLRR